MDRSATFNIFGLASRGWALFENPLLDKIPRQNELALQSASYHSTDGWLSLVEGTGFENRRRGNSSGGSNPSPSALSLIGVFQMSSRLSKLNGLCGSPHFKFCTRWFDRNLATNSAKLKQNGHCYFSCELLAVSIRSGHQWGWGGYLLRHSTVY